MELQGFYRHELKYQISFADYLAIRQKILPIMKVDKNTDDNGRYFIRSIYFDNIDDKALREKINGVQKREKFRIRYYNDDLSFISLEKKMKQNNLCRKLSEEITEDECRSILDDKIDWLMEHPSELVREFYCKMKMQQLRPGVVVSYLREPYVYEAGNVRVTFDSKIRTSLYHKNCLENEIEDIPATDSPNQIVMEIKYDAFLPKVIQSLVQTDGIRQQAFSKYRMSRRFG